MFIKILLGYILGYIRVSIEGYYIERFINICNSQKILIWNLKKDKNVGMEFNVGISDFKKIIKIAKKTKCKVKIKRKRGVPFILNRYKKRKIFLVLILAIIIAAGVLSQFIWNIEIKVEEENILDGISQTIENAGLKTGILKSKIDTKEIINKIRLERQDIAWVGIKLKGTNAIVSLVKADSKPEIVNEEDYCSIVSDKVGVITKINSQNGTANVKVGDIVNVGTPLINGWLEGKYTGIRYVHAKGEILAKVWHTKNVFIKYKNVEKSKTGNVQKIYGIKFNNFQINLQKKLPKFEIYDTIEAEKKFKIFSDFYLPITIQKTVYEEQIEEQKTYSIEEAKSLGIKQLEEELDNEIQEKENIVNKNVNTYEKEDGLEIYVTYEVLETIGTNEKIVF